MYGHADYLWPTDYQIDPRWLDPMFANYCPRSRWKYPIDRPAPGFLARLRTLEADYGPVLHVRWAWHQ